MNLSYRHGGEVGIVHVHADRLDAASAIRFKDLFDALTTAGPGAGAGIVLLDLGEVEFLDSSGLGAIVAARKRLGSQRTLALGALQPAVSKVIRLTHMDRVFDVYGDTAAFLQAQGKSEAV